MGKTFFETLVGAIVLLIAGFFVMTMINNGKKDDTKSYSLYAKFDRIDGLHLASDVRVSGLVVGKVISQEIEPASYLAKVTFSVDDAVKIPDDSTAEIVSDGLLGAKYLALVPGGSENYLKKGDRVKYTQPAISLESLIGKFVFGGAQDKDAPKEKAPAPAALPDANAGTGSATPAAPAKSEDDIFKTP